MRCVILLLLAPAVSLAQQPADANTLQALLNEVRQLRIALERSTSMVPRMQLLVTRYQMQQDRVDRQERDLRALRNQLTSESSGRERTSAALRQFEEQARQTQDPAARKHLEEAAAAARMDLEQQAAREQQVRAEEAELASQLKLEQARLGTIAEQLDRIEKLLTQP